MSWELLQCCPGNELIRKPIRFLHLARAVKSAMQADPIGMPEYCCFCFEYDIRCDIVWLQIPESCSTVTLTQLCDDKSIDGDV